MVEYVAGKLESLHLMDIHSKSNHSRGIPRTPSLSLVTIPTRSHSTLFLRITKANSTASSKDSCFGSIEDTPSHISLQETHPDSPQIRTCDKEGCSGKAVIDEGFVSRFSITMQDGLVKLFSVLSLSKSLEVAILESGFFYSVLLIVSYTTE